mmetsp:Transcript_24660/g.64763  ORF Transcript_24660/g.64763 Transcript_24660/m.64763 type:complete len:222 (-) Transcript_24660:271-936(-)
MARRDTPGDTRDRNESALSNRVQLFTWHAQHMMNELGADFFAHSRGSVRQAAARPSKVRRRGHRATRRELQQLTVCAAWHLEETRTCRTRLRSLSWPRPVRQVSSFWTVGGQEAKCGSARAPRRRANTDDAALPGLSSQCTRATSTTLRPANGPSRRRISRRARTSSRASTTGRLEVCTAKCRGVVSFLSKESIMARWWINIFTMATSPLSAAWCRGVRPA